MDQSEDRLCSIALYNSQQNYIAFSFLHLLVQESLAKIEFKLPDDSLMRMDRHLADYKCGEFSGAETLFIRPDAFEGWKTEARSLNDYVKENMVTSKNQEMASRMLNSHQAKF